LRRLRDEGAGGGGIGNALGNTQSISKNLEKKKKTHVRNEIVGVCGALKAHAGPNTIKNLTVLAPFALFFSKVLVPEKLWHRDQIWAFFFFFFFFFPRRGRVLFFF
jgi:hypothetical protein